MVNISVINSEISDEIELSCIFCENNQFDSIEIHTAWNENIELLGKDALQTLKKTINDHHLKVSCISSTIFLRCYSKEHTEILPEIHGFKTINGDLDFHLHALQNAFLCSEILGTPFIRIFGFMKNSETETNTHSMAVEQLSRAAIQAEKAGCILVLENCPFTSFGWSSSAAKLINDVNSPALRLLWDPAGAIRAGEPHCLQEIQQILPLVKHIHAKDILAIENGHGKYGVLGSGLVPWEDILKSLLQRNFQGAISLEPHYIGKDGSKKAAIVESKKALEKLMSQSCQSG